MGTAVETRKAKTPAVKEPVHPMTLIERAMRKGIDSDQLSKLMDLQERWDKQQARLAFNDALSRFQADCPSVQRNKKVSYAGGAEYEYATLAQIKKTIQEPLMDNNLSYQFEITDGVEEIAGEKVDFIRVTCILRHRDGHSESNSMHAYPDDSGKKNDIQSRGSAITYMMRYTLIGVLGLATADTDDDGQSADVGGGYFLKRHAMAVRELFDVVALIKEGIHIGDLSKASEAWGELTDEEKEALWLAPTKGGVFTTEERRIMKSREFFEAYRTSVEVGDLIEGETDDDEDSQET